MLRGAIVEYLLVDSFFGIPQGNRMVIETVAFVTLAFGKLYPVYRGSIVSNFSFELLFQLVRLFPESTYVGVIFEEYLRRKLYLSE